MGPPPSLPLAGRMPWRTLAGMGRMVQATGQSLGELTVMTVTMQGGRSLEAMAGTTSELRMFWKACEVRRGLVRGAKVVLTPRVQADQATRLGVCESL